MIRLTLNAQSSPEIHLFNKSTITIGCASPEVDLSLPDSSLKPLHLKIIEQNGFLVLINAANDPFVTLNGHPFGKKLLKTGDVIQIHHIDILFENLNDAIPETLSSEITQSTPLLQLLDAKMPELEAITQITSGLALPEFSLADLTPKEKQAPFEPVMEEVEGDEWRTTDLDAVLQELEEKQQRHTQIPAVPPQSTVRVAPKVHSSLKDDYLRELDDDHHAQKEEESFNDPSHLYQAWKWILLFILSVLSIAAIIGMVIYFSVSDKTEAQETKAAQGVADIAMALTHAQLYQLKPPNQNWSDVEFIKSNLQTILPNTASYASQIDAQGQFNCCPYSLRIYTSSDLSRFLLIAQPAPSLLQWLIPKSVILVDSEEMELRTIKDKDVRTLNRLLTNPDPLDGANSKEISILVKQSNLIRLLSLASESGHMDLAPPKNLAWIRPGAENLIYNAPRYFRLSQALIQKAMLLSMGKGTSQDVATLKQDVENFSRLNSFIIYADQGKRVALLTKQGLATFASIDKMLFGYVAFNQQGKIDQAHLLKDEDDLKDTSPLAPLPSLDKEEAIAFHPPTSKPMLAKPEEVKTNVDTNHPLCIHLCSLARAREAELQPMQENLLTMLEQEMHQPKASFQADFQQATHHYLMANAKHKTHIKNALATLYQQYEGMPIEEFIGYVKTAGLDHLIQPGEHCVELADESCQQNFETILTYIENAKNLTELDSLIHIGSSWLTFDYIKDSEGLVKYQNSLRNAVLRKLEKFFLSDKKHLNVKLMKSDEKDILQHILNYERIIKSEERDYFLEEFNHLFEDETVAEAKEKE